MYVNFNKETNIVEFSNVLRVNGIPVCNNDFVSEHYSYVDEKVVYTPDSEAAIRYNKKQEKNILLATLEVEYNGIIFQADELSQSRMSNALLVMSTDSIIEWIAKDNSVHLMSKFDMENLLKKCIQKHSEIRLLSKQI